jgi:hypothetical protein
MIQHGGRVILLETLTCRARLLMHVQDLSARTWVMEKGFVYSTPVGARKGISKATPLALSYIKRMLRL